MEKKLQCYRCGVEVEEPVYFSVAEDGSYEEGEQPPKAPFCQVCATRIVEE